MVNVQLTFGRIRTMIFINSVRLYYSVGNLNLNGQIKLQILVKHHNDNIRQQVGKGNASTPGQPSIAKIG